MQLMREFGWTEKQLRDEVTIEMLERIKFVMSEEGRKMKRDEIKAKAQAKAQQTGSH